MLEQSDSKKQISLPGLIFVGIGSMIGSGWLFGSFFSAQLAGPSAIFAWIIAAIVNFIIALPLIEVGSMFPIKGSFIEIAYLTHGKLTGFFLIALSWLSMAAIAPIEAQGVLLYLGNYFPSLLIKIGHVYALSHRGIRISVVLLFIFTLINFFSIRFISRFNSIITSWKILIPILTIIVLCFSSFHLQNFTSHGFWVNKQNGITNALISGGVIYSLLGFRQMITLASEAENPGRNVPIAIITSLIITAILYVILQFVFIAAMKPEWLSHGWQALSFPHDKGPLAGLAQDLGLLWLAIILYADAVISPSGTGLLYTTTTARVVCQAAKQGAAPNFLGQLNRFQSPIIALTLNFIFGVLFLRFFLGWQAMSGFIVLCLILSYAITPINLVVLRNQLPDQPRPFRLKGGKFISCLAFILCNCIAYLAGWVLFKPLLVMLLICLFIFTLTQYFSHEFKKSHWLSGSWIIIHLVGMSLIAYAGSYAETRAFLQHPIDFMIVTVWSIFIFYLAWYTRIMQIGITHEIFS